ncbi:MAG: protein ndvB [Parachlamydiaceae bacterium]|nr:protein ndvB [Parachlamydiaceae bacterium]
MKKRNVALGFYQEISTANAVIKELKNHKFSRFALFRRRADHELDIKRNIPANLSYIFLAGIFSILIIVALKYFLNIFSWAVTAAVIATLSFYAYYIFRKIISTETINRFKDRVIIDEILIVVEVGQFEVREVLSILRNVQSGHPATFLLRPPMNEPKDVEIGYEPLPLELLCQSAAQLSVSLRSTQKNHNKHFPKASLSLIDNFQKKTQMLRFLQCDIADAEYIEHTIPTAAEWLLDNMYIIEGSIKDVKINLPKPYYKKLPKIVEGPLQGLPRIYALAIEFVKDTAGDIDQEKIVHFLNSYQISQPLTIGELWAFPLMLRLRIIEWVENLAIRVDNRMREGELASFWGNRFLYAALHEPSRFPALLHDIASDETVFSVHFAQELLDHLFDQETILPQIREWLEKYFSAPLANILHEDHVQETSQQIVFSNLIKSLISISHLSWINIFETVSPVDAVLRKDFNNIYSEMDFATRNSYRNTIEEIGVRIHLSEVEIAKKALDLSLESIKEYEKHIGYYLIDNGREVLEQAVGYKPVILQGIRRWIIKHPQAIYFGAIAFLTTLGVLAAFYLVGFSRLNLLLISLALIPISELCIQFVNIVLTFILHTPLRPKMLYEHGIPKEYKTLIVVPMILHNGDSIPEEIERLEIRYLANTDPLLTFALFSDFADAKQQHLDNDEAFLSQATEGIQALDKKYGPNKFFLFHRQRSWSPSENAWIGWERKRGKLEFLNRFLVGEQLPEQIVYSGDIEALKGIRFVITLDSDTQLPKDKARALVEVLAHPLNRPYLTEDKKSVERGFTIIQPRVASDFLQAKSSWFARIFSEVATMDPYTHAISNIYQDLDGEGSYHGKGIYDLEAFHTLLSHHFPEEHLLSHDLIEGAFVRVGFAGNICLYDMHPQNYLVSSKRLHRWIRGDWQIINWLRNLVPVGKGEVELNPLTWFNRWKIFDNLRRSLLPIALLSLFVGAWIYSPNYKMWTGLSLFVLLIPSISLVLNRSGVISFEEFKLIFSELKFSILRSLVNTALLPYEAYSTLDAIFRVAYRRFFSKRNLLQWTPSEQFLSTEKKHCQFVFHLIWVSIFAVVTFIIVCCSTPHTCWIALPFCLLWLIAPWIVHLLDKPLSQKVIDTISIQDQEMLRKLGCKTWRYFDELVGPQTHWLPPDNYQTALNVEVAQRTSPTNIGLWLIALVNAYDFKYITSDDLIDRSLATVDELKKLEKYEGHLLNWYNIQTLDPLFPRYVSTVDSGNLLACLWTVKQALLEMISNPIIPKKVFQGIVDACGLLSETYHSPEIEAFCIQLNKADTGNLSEFILTIQNALLDIENLSAESINSYWRNQIKKQLESWNLLISRYFSWVTIINALNAENFSKIDPQALFWKNEVFAWKPSFEMFATNDILPSLFQLIAAAHKSDVSEIVVWGKQLNEAVSNAQWFAGEKVGIIKDILKTIEQFSAEMSFKFLYSDERKLFSIGYNVDEKRLDNSYYDLLASEARIASLVAIAKEDVPLEHWWALGRVYSSLDGHKILLSWGGTMFEYLMPLIFNKHYPDSLLGEACRSAVISQISYGEKRGIPWGISESAFSAIDTHKIYQYRSFGIPGLGLKRGLEEDLVISPYSTVLALMVDAKSALENLKILSDKKHAKYMGAYGFYDAVDFTRRVSPKGERGVVIYVYMAHHQGMILAALNNLLNNDNISTLFQKDPRMCGINSLLYERIPTSPPIKITHTKKNLSHARLKPFSQSPIMGVVETPNSVTPKINLLSNEKYTLMISNTGGGYSRWGDIEIYRWRADTTRDSWGSFCYIKDINSGDIWSSTYQPTQKTGKEYSVNFKGDRAEFRRKDHQIEVLTDVVVSPEDNAEIRLISLTNHSSIERYIELTSYLELSLAPHLTDRSHPCFNKLFIETEALPEFYGLLAFRRLRSPEEQPLWAVHSISSSIEYSDNIQFETDRNKFIGRGNSLRDPAAMHGDLSNSVGTVLDPIFSLRRRVLIEPGRRVQFSLITAIADNRSAAIALLSKYFEIGATHRAIELAWTYSQLELRHLRIQEEEVQLFQKLASRLIYPHAQLRSAEERIRKNHLGQSALWAQSISGNLPIVVVTVGDSYDADLVKQVLFAHDFWSRRGLKVDLVVLNEEEVGYMQPLQEHLQNLVQAHSYRNPAETPGGVFLRNIHHIPEEELNLILAAAGVVLIASRGTLRQQLVSPKPRKLPPKLVISEKIEEVPSEPLPFLELPYFNGLGGYTHDGQAYVIYLGPNTNTPAPWINVLANSEFGTLVSEAGLGCTWYGNSQTNRLTAWSNDPLLDPITDAIYIRDDKLGAVWTPTPSPIRELDAYRISHGQGYSKFEHNSHGIEQELMVFVPVNDLGGRAIRVQRLRLKNCSPKQRHLTITAYSEWVLGADKEDTQLHVITEWDSESQALLAYNRYNTDFGNYVAFACSSVIVKSFTGDRAEFIGRNRSSSNPEAMERETLSGKTGAALDPCSALQVSIESNPGEIVEIIFTIGYAPDIATARQLIFESKNPDRINQLFNETCAWWDKTLGVIQVDVPDKATNFHVNRWLIYQDLVCRFWGRSGFYQSSGAYGFRDQLQDVMALVYTLPALARDYILTAASRQFVEGDVQHWWHSQTGAGIRTRCSDDLLWLPYVTAQYIRVTGDASILEEQVLFLEGDLLNEGQEEVYFVPRISNEEATLLEHCRRALQKGITSGPHGLPLIGSCDWNDGMNRVGVDGKGESVWLGWFLIHVMNDFADLLTYSSDQKEMGEGFRVQSKRLAEIIETTSWDGTWYRRAYFDDGTPIGSKENTEAFIDSLTQSWAVISGMADPERSAMALKSAEEFLVKYEEKLILLLTPPFDKISHDPGYIKGYPPGVRENGGQYTHGSSWLAMAFARTGQGKKAYDILKILSPTLHTSTVVECELYKVEPYVIVADIYQLKDQVGRGGWSWYTGSAGWIYRIWIEEILGFKLRGDVLSIECCIPEDWDQFKLDYKHKSSTLYSIIVTNPDHVSRGSCKVTLDGVLLEGQDIYLNDDGAQHVVNIVLVGPGV